MAEGDAVKVCLRVRPLIHREQDVNLIWKADSNTICQVDGVKSFSFDRIFHSHETTSQVYQEIGVPIIRSALQGYNGTIFAYGQTSSGKTYTMMGTADHLGIIPQAIQEVFRIIQEIPNREFLLRVSYMEIYNDTVTDLLCDDRKKKPLEVREDIDRNVYVADLTEELVMVPDHVMKWIKKGEKKRHYGETKMNDHSSRSHTIFRMIVESRERNDPGNSENCDGAVMVSHLNLVDLAGSERASQTGAEGMRLKEGCNINRSLFILGQVIKKLSDGQVGGFINYRDSKLTRILQNSLGGNTKTLIICTVTPVSFDETLSTLQFASTAKYVRNTPHINEVLDDQALLKRYRKEIMDLKKQLEELEVSSEIRAHAMAKEEHSGLLAEIKQLQKEKEDRIWNLTNIVVASSQELHEEQRVKRKRRVTWAPGKLQNSLRADEVSPFERGSKLTNFPKRPKISDISPILEVDDSICTEYSDFDDASRALDDFAPDTDWNFGTGVSHREKTTALSHSMMDFSSESTSSLTKDSSLQKCKDLEQKVAELENELKRLTEEYEMEVGRRESLEKDTAHLKKQLQSKDDKCELEPTVELEVTCLRDQIETMPESGQQNVMPEESSDITEKLSPLKADNEQELEKLNDSPLSDGIYQDPVQEKLVCHTPGGCWEQIQMLEQKIADLEGNASPENNNEDDLMESLQICEALMVEKQSAHDELATMQNNFDHLVEENESLKREIADLEKCLQERHEINEFERLEKETQKDHEAQLIHEISNLKKLIEHAEMYNQDLENELENKSKFLKEQEKQMANLMEESKMLRKKSSHLDLSASMGDSEKLCDEVLRMKQSVSDAETVTLDAQKEAAFLRSENLELKEKMDELSIRCDKREKDASGYEKQLEVEKANYKRMQADLQKELQHAFNEINQLNGLLAGKVPKDLLSHVELDKKVADYSKQLASILEQNKALEQEVASLLEYKSLPSEVEHLKEQVQKTSEELMMLKDEKEQSASKLNEQHHKLLEQVEQIEKLTGEATLVQAKFQQAEQQYSELKMLHESLQDKCSLVAEDVNKKDIEAECLLKEMDKLKHSVECLEQKLSGTLQENDELLQAKQELETHVKELEELLKSSCMENGNIQDHVNNAFEIATLQQQTEKLSELYKEKQDLQEKYIALLSEKEQASSLNATLPENPEDFQKLQELQDELKLVVQHRDELIVKVENIEVEKETAKQELNENLELSAETQGLLRTTQEELKEQKQLVEDLRKQIADCAGDILTQAQSQIKVLEEKLSMITVKQQETEEKNEIVTKEKMEFVSVNQNLISEMNLLQQRAQTIDLALSKAEEENNDLKERLKDQLKSGEPDQLINSSTNLQESEILEDDLNRQVKQEDDVKSLQLREQMLAMLQEKETLHEMLENVTAERNQLKLDLQDNIEMSIDTQEELRSALDDLKVKTQLLESLRTQMNENENQVLGLQEKLLEKSAEYQQLLKDKEKLEQDNLLRFQIEGHMKETEATLQSLQNEKLEVQRHILDLQQQIKIITQERDHLINTQRRCISETDQGSQTENNDQASRLENDLEQRTIQCHEDLVQDNLALNNDLEILRLNLKNSDAELEVLRSEKFDYEKKINQLQHQVEHTAEELENLKVAQQCLLSEREQLKEELEKNVEKLFHLQEEVLQNANVHQELIQKNEELEQQQITQTCEINNLMKTLAETQSILESLKNEKLQAGQELGALQQQMDRISQERDELRAAKESLTSEMATLKNMEENQQKITENKEAMQAQPTCNHEFSDNLKDMEAELLSLRNEKLNLEEKIFSLQQHTEMITNERGELKVTLQSLLSERDQLKEDLRENVEMSIETQDDLRKTQDDLQQQRQTVEELMCQIASLEEKSSSVEHKLQNMVSLLEESNNEQEILEQSKQKLVLELEHLQNIRSTEFTVRQSEADQKILSLTAQLKTMSEQQDQMKLTKEASQKQSTETQDELKRTQEELHQQKQRVEKLTHDISLLEEKSSSLERELQEKIHILNKAVEERHIFEQCKQELSSEMEQVLEDLKSKDFDLKQAEKEKEAASLNLFELDNKMKSIVQERDDLQRSKENLEEEANRLKEETQQLKDEQKILADEDIRKSSQINELETELQQIKEKMHLNDAFNKQLETDKVALQKQLQHSELEVASLQQEQEQLKRAQNEKELIYSRLQEQEKAAERLKEEIQQLKDEQNILADKEIRKSSQINELLTELQQIKEQMHLSDSSNKQLETDKVGLQKQLQHCELEIASLHQEQEQLQQLLQRARNEKELIYSSLQEQEKAVAQLQDELIASQTKLEAVKEERKESNSQLAEKVNEVNELLQEISSLQEQMQQLHQNVKDEKIKNWDLCENVNLLEREITALRLIQSEPAEEDEIAERTETLEKKNQELKDLMENISTVYSHHHSLLDNLSSDLQSEVEAQKQSISAIKETLSSMLSRALGNLQTEHIKLNSQMQAVLHKFKVIYRNAAVKEEHYSLVSDYESELCALQKRNDELLLQCQSLEQRGTKWSEGTAEELKFCELEFINQLLFKKVYMMKHVEEDFSEVKDVLNSLETDLKEETKCKKEFIVWLEDFKGSQFDNAKLNDGVVQENRRIVGVIQHLRKKMKIIAQSKAKQETMNYLKSLETDLEEKKEKNKELLQRMQQIAPAGDSNILEEENAQLRETLRNNQVEFKKMQSRLQVVENELSLAKADAKQNEQRALLLEDKLRCKTAESELSEMQVKMNDKEKHLQAALKEIKVLQEKVSKDAAPYKDEMDSLKTEVVRLEMDRMKTSKATEQQIASLKACIEDKEECLRKLKEQLRRTQRDTDTTICSGNCSSPQYPLTCGGGSGIVQSTAMLMMQSENAALKREIAQYKKKCHQLSRNISFREDELKKLKDRSCETPSTLLSSLHHDKVMPDGDTDMYKPAIPSKSEMPTCYVMSPGKTGIHRKRELSPSKSEMDKPQMSPNKMERHSVPVMSPGNTGLHRKYPVSPHKKDGPLFSTLTTSPCKTQKLPVKTASPKDTFFDVRSKSLPYCPSKFFDNSNLGALPDPHTQSSDSNPSEDSDTDLYTRTTTETSGVNWWDQAGKSENPNDCKTS